MSFIVTTPGHLSREKVVTHPAAAAALMWDLLPKATPAGVLAETVASLKAGDSFTLGGLTVTRTA